MNLHIYMELISPIIVCGNEDLKGVRINTIILN